MAWDEENRLMALSDNGKTSRYTYISACTEVPREGGLHHLSRTHPQRHTPAFHQALLHRRQTHCLQTRNRQVQQCLWRQQQQCYGRPERLCCPHAADRETARGVLQVLRHTSWCSHDEGCNGRSRQHRLWLQHHHRRAGRPQRARRLGTTTEVL